MFDSAVRNITVTADKVMLWMFKSKGWHCSCSLVCKGLGQHPRGVRAAPQVNWSNIGVLNTM